MMTEERIERIVERRTDAADHAYMHGQMDFAQYQKTLSGIDAWAESQYAKRPGHRLLWSGPPVPGE